MKDLRNKICYKQKQIPHDSYLNRPFNKVMQKTDSVSFYFGKKNYLSTHKNLNFL